MENRRLKFVLVLSLALNVSMLSATGYFFYRHYSRHHRYGGMSRRERTLLESVSLRPGQIKTIEEKSRDFYALMDRKRGDLIDLKKVLVFVLFTDNPDRQKINDIIDEINGVQKEIQAAVAEHVLEEKAVMDEKQRQKFYDIVEKSLEKRRPAPEAGRD